MCCSNLRRPEVVKPGILKGVKQAGVTVERRA